MGAPKVDPGLQQRAADFAREKVEEVFVDSNIADASDSYPRFKFEELKLGKVLGKGGFGTVWEIKAFIIDGIDTSKSLHSRDLDAEVAAGEKESRKFISEHCLRNGGDPRYAVKKLSGDKANDTAHSIQGMMDMAIETRFLSDINSHPNIVKLRALAKGNPYSNEYFIVLDRLYDTLEKRLEKWKRRSAATKGLFACFGGDAKAHSLYEEKIIAAFDLASAIEFLHSRKILYRDLKPENIGFDIRDDIKLFDFGLAKELSDKVKLDDGTYKLTEMTGSPRYMSPEVANGQSYNETCDVYSYAILLWQILTCRVPYELYTPKSLREKVYNGAHKRPPMTEDIPGTMAMLLETSWCANICERIKMPQVSAMLRKECVDARNGDESGLEHSRRRSTFVFSVSRHSAEKRAKQLAELNALDAAMSDDE